MTDRDLELPLQVTRNELGGVAVGLGLVLAPTLLLAIGLLLGCVAIFLLALVNDE